MRSHYTMAWFAVLLLACPALGGYGQLDAITDSLLREVVSRMGGGGGQDDPLDEFGGLPKADPDDFQLGGLPKAFEARRDALLGPSLRDQEFLEHSSLFGHQSMQGGAGEGFQRLRPDGSMKNMQVVKTDASLPAYCNPANPCPLGYTAEDGCLEEFSNTAAFSREYQAAQDCICDSEHMFDCPGATRDAEIDALARSFDNEGLTGNALDTLVRDMQIRGDHKVVAKKFFKHKPSNPFLEGEKLPVVAKKTPHTAKN